MGDDVGERNVARLQQDPRSLLWLYRSLIRLRKKEKPLTAGSYVPMRSRNDVLIFKRSYGDTELLVALNFSHDPRKLPLDPTADLLISTHLDREPGVVQSSLILRGDEGVIIASPTGTVRDLEICCHEVAAQQPDRLGLLPLPAQRGRLFRRREGEGEKQGARVPDAAQRERTHELFHDLRTRVREAVRC
jgi:Domain of unknown function (DUF3459)